MKDLSLIEFTPKAKQHIEHMLETKGETAFRLSVKKTGCSGYMYLPEVVSETKPGDIEHMTSEGIRVFVEGTYVDLLRGTVIDYVKKDLGMEQLVFNNPNAEGLCGCGESFQVKEKSEGES